MKTIKAEFTYFNEKEIVEIELNEELDDMSSQGIDSEVADHFIDWLLRKVEANYRIIPNENNDESQDPIEEITFNL